MKETTGEDRGGILLYRTEDDWSFRGVRLSGEAAWLTQAQIADLFAVDVPAVSRHIKNIRAIRIWLSFPVDGGRLWCSRNPNGAAASLSATG